MAWLMYKWPISGRREGSIGTTFLILVLGTPLFLSVKRNGKKILEHQF